MLRLTLLMVVACYTATAQELPRQSFTRPLSYKGKPATPSGYLYERFIQARDWRNAVFAGLQLGEYYRKQPNFTGALYYDSMAVIHARQVTDTILLQKALASYAWTLSETFRLKEATQLIQTNNAVFINSITVESCNWQHAKAAVLLKDMQFSAALAECRLGVGTAISLQDSAAIMQIRLLMARIFVMRGLADSARIAYLAYDYFRKEQLLGEAAQAASVIALNFIRTANPDGALQYYQQAGNLYRQDNDWNGAATAEMNTGEAWVAKQDFKAAKAAYVASRWFYQKTVQRSGLVSALVRLGSLYTTLRMYDSAAYYLSAAEATGKPLKSSVIDLIMNGFKARLGLSNNDTALTNEAGEKAIGLLNKRPDKEILNDLAAKLAEGDLLKWSEMQQATRFFNKKKKQLPAGTDTLETSDSSAYGRLSKLSPFTGTDVGKDSSIIANSHRISLDMESVHEAKEANLKLQAQQQQNKITQLEAQKSKDTLRQERNTKTGIVISSVIVILLIGTGLWVQYKNRRRAERDRAQIEELQKEIHHRVTNNLGVINAMVEMASKASASQLSMSTLKTRIDSIALVHRLLYSGTAATGKIALQPYFEALSTAIAAIFERDEVVKITVDALIETNSVLAEKLGLIVNELITNSFKYAFVNKEDGTIHLYIRQKENELYLTVADNGTGLPPDARKGQGSKLIKGLCHQLKGKYNYQNINGTFFEMTLQLPTRV